MTPRQKLFRIAAEAGIDVDHTPRDEAGPATLNLWSPQGKVFASSDCHVDASIDALTDTGSIDWVSATAQLERIIGIGMKVCPDLPNCEHCNP